MIFASQQSNIFFQNGVQFILGDAADGRKLRIHTDVGKIIDGAEDAELREFCDSRDKGKMNMRTVGFNRRIKLLYDSSYSFQFGFIMQHIK